MVEKNYLKRFNITYPFQISLYDYITLRDLRLTFALNTIMVQKTNYHKLINLANIKSFFFSALRFEVSLLQGRSYDF